MNTNALVGIRCPKCGNEDKLLVECKAVATVIDNGVEDVTDFDWGKGSMASCPDCGESGTWASFSV